MVYHTIHLPVINLRENPKENAPIISQACFSEHVLVKKELGEWIQVVTLDGYNGWIEKKSSVQRDEPYCSQGKVTQLRADVFENCDQNSNIIMTLAYGAKFLIQKKINERWLQIELPNQKIAYIQRGALSKEPKEFQRFAKQFLGIPYIWGGRSSFGFDCSGYVQMLYLWKGIQLPRDSHQQYADPRGKKVPLDQLVLGDLIFWGKSERQIQHVAMYLGDGEFIHTSMRENLPFLRISRLTDPEWSSETKGSYSFRGAKRFFHDSY